MFHGDVECWRRCLPANDNASLPRHVPWQKYDQYAQKPIAKQNPKIQDPQDLTAKQSLNIQDSQGPTTNETSRSEIYRILLQTVKIQGKNNLRNKSEK